MNPEIRRVGQRASLYSLLRQELFDEWLTEQLGPNDYFVDPEKQLFGFIERDGEKSITTRPFLLATVAMQPATVLWGFAEFHESNTGPNPAARGIRRFGVDHQLAAFSNEEAPYRFDEATHEQEVSLLCHDLGQAAVEVFGPEILYSSVPNGDDGSRAVYLHTELSEPAPRPRFGDVVARLPRLLETCDDVAWSLGGLARLLGWTFEQQEQPNSWLLHHQPGETMTVVVEYDSAGRQTKVRVETS